MIYFLFFLQLIVVIVGVGILVRFVGMVVSLWLEVPYVATPKKMYPEIERLLKLTPNDRCADLGSGFGDFCFYLAEQGGLM